MGSVGDKMDCRPSVASINIVWFDAFYGVCCMFVLFIGVKDTGCLLLSKMKKER